MKFRATAVFAFACWAIPRGPSACGFCAAEELERLFPAANFWAAIAVFWLLGLAFLHDVYQPKRFFAPGMGFVALCLLLAFISGAIMLGTLPAALFALWCAASWEELVRLNPGPSNAPFRRRVHGLGIAALVALVATFIFAEWREARRSRVDEILYWREGVGSVFQGQTPTLDESREIAERSMNLLRGIGIFQWSVRALVDNGDPVKEARFLRTLLRRAERGEGPYSRVYAQDLSDAIQELDARAEAERALRQRAVSLAGGGGG